MRTTIDIDDDVLERARELAKRQRRSVGSVISRLARDGFEHAPYAHQPSGLPVFKESLSAKPIDEKLVKELQDGDDSAHAWVPARRKRAARARMARSSAPRKR